MENLSYRILVLICALSMVEGVLKIVAPLPGHRVAIENETLTVTCVAFDEENPSVKPLGFEFYRLNRLGEKTAMEKGEDYSFSRRTEVNGRKLFASLLFKRIKPADDGRYECKILNTSDVGARYGFGITYISYASLPQIAVSPNKTVEFGDELSLQCNLTRTGNFFVTLVTMAWSKDGELLSTVPRPHEIKLRDITMEIDRPGNGGFYQCKLTTVLHQQRTFNITKVILIKVKPRFNSLNLKNNRIVQNKGEPAVLHCNATGNPITVVWKRKPRNEAKNQTLDVEASTSNGSHYRITSTTPFEGFKLKIASTDYSDRGFYYCCIRSNTSSDEICQKYVLRIKDPLGYLWPLIGIAIEALVLVIIVYVSTRLKLKEDQNQRSDVTMEFKFTSSEDVKEGRVRLRKTGISTALQG